MSRISRYSISVFVVSKIFFVSLALSQELPSVAKGSGKQTLVAKSDEELSSLVVATMDKEDYEALMQLMLPVNLLKDVGAPKEALEHYDGYLKTVPTMARRYRRLLQQEKWLPLAQWKYFEVKPRDPETKNGFKVVFSTGIRLTTDDRTKGFELVDQTVGINGRWYILRLCNEETEERLTKAAAR